MDECAQALSRWQLPFEVRTRSGSFHPHDDTIKVMTMHASKGLEFPVVALLGVRQMPAAGEDERDEARLFYVGATRSTQMLVITASGEEDLEKDLGLTEWVADFRYERLFCISNADLGPFL